MNGARARDDPASRTTPTPPDSTPGSGSSARAGTPASGAALRPATRATRDRRLDPHPSPLRNARAAAAPCVPRRTASPVRRHPGAAPAPGHPAPPARDGCRAPARATCTRTPPRRRARPAPRAAGPACGGGRRHPASRRPPATRGRGASAEKREAHHAGPEKPQPPSGRSPGQHVVRESHGERPVTDRAGHPIRRLRRARRRR